MALRKDEFHYEADERESTNKSQSTEWHDLTIRVSAELDERIQKAAEQQNVSIEQYLEDMLNDVVPVSHLWKPLNPKGIEKLRQFQAQLLKERGGVPFGNSVELLREAREEREKERGF
jgi:hypothetical protein